MHDEDENLRALKELEKRRTEIEKELGFKLDFQELPEKRACRIEHSIATDVAFTHLDQKRKNELVEWGAKKMLVFSKVLSKHIAKL